MSIKLCLISDIDGTLAIRAKGEKFDKAKILDYKVNLSLTVIQNAISLKYPVFIFTSRDESLRKDTEKWLKDNNVKYEKLFMRAIGDNREDTLVKEDMYKLIYDEYGAIGVFEDRKDIQEMYNCHGLFVLNVKQTKFYNNNYYDN